MYIIFFVGSYLHVLYWQFNFIKVLKNKNLPAPNLLQQTFIFGYVRTVYKNHKISNSKYSDRDVYKNTNRLVISYIIFLLNIPFFVLIKVTG